MSKKVLIDGSQEKEVRLLVTENGQISDISLQGVRNNQTRGNVYLAKICRVEASLQAVFIEYGDDKNGFLPFSEIHPDYFQISAEEKEKLMSQLQKSASGESEDADPEDERKNRQRYYGILSEYKVQEVIKKDQVILAQVTKERRGNKGAAFTTYISIPGRFCVLMPKSINQGGISKKILEKSERERLKSLLDEFHSKNNNQSSVVIRTAGECKTKSEIRRDFEYASKIWDNIKKHTLDEKTTAPSFIYKEGDIVKQAIRDLYNSDVEEIVVSGKESYEDTVSFMQFILPRHVDKVKFYDESTPIFSKYGVEEQINNLYENEVELQSGGHIVIQSTEALISVDVNSGKYTDERSVENTALRTNLEAAQEVAKQIMLRSLSGLIVIDFIDMRNEDNKSKVEKELRKAFSEDRAKVIMGKIGRFGLLEMSRQRIKQPFLESNTIKCAACNGKGFTRRAELTTSSIIRNLNYFLCTHQYSQVKVIASPSILLSLMQHCKRDLLELEEKYYSSISFEYDHETTEEVFYIEQISGDYKEEGNVPLSESDNAQYTDDYKQSHNRKRRGNRKNTTQEDNPSANETSFEDEGNNMGNSNADDDSMRKSDKKEDRPHQKTKREGRRAASSGKRRIAHGKRVDKSQKLPNTESGNANASSGGDANNSLLKDIWRKIID